MEEILEPLRLKTSQLQLEHFQVTLNFTQKIKKNAQPDELQSFVNEASGLLWKHLNAVLPTTECQLMCATSFFALLAFNDQMEQYIKEIDDIISDHYTAKTEDRFTSRMDTLITKSLIYGIYQSPFLSLVKEVNRRSAIESLLEHSFQVLILSAYQYSEFTFITFKTLQSTRKLLHSDFKNVLLTNEKHITLLTLTSHNWENPITGIRDLNKMIFGMYLDMGSLINDPKLSYEKLMIEVNSFPWNKAKYLMLSEIIIRAFKSAKSMFESNSDWLDGLLKSLTSGLVSAGADMYFAVLTKINSDTEWCDIFLDAVLNILNESEFKALENFNNYWCLNTLKRFPKIMEILTDNLQNLESENSLYAYLSILRQGNKTGVLNRSFFCSDSHTSADNGGISVLQRIKNGLEHINANIRIQTFEIICVSRNNTFPSELEFNLILKFLKDNVNSDSTVLRLSMLNNIKLFFTRLFISTTNIIKNDPSEADQMPTLVKFSADLQFFLKSNLEMQGNYQRKITTVKLCEYFLSAFSQPLQRKRRPNLTTTSEFTLKRWCFLLKEEDFIENLLKCLDDPAEDVRDTASTILLNHYAEIMSAKRNVEKLLDNSLMNIRSKFFYEVSSGHSGLKLICHLLIKSKFESFRFNTIEEMFQYFLNDLITEIDRKTDILTSIEKGKPLHSMICILQNILEVCLLNSHALHKILRHDVINILLVKLSEIPNYYILEERMACSPDFSEMSEMVENIISNSSSKRTIQETNVKISDLHQIVLNCVWLNLKACCDLLCVLVKCTHDFDHCNKCLNIIASVLETSRHKGAIEAAGVALGKCVKHLTSLPKNLAISQLPMKLLKGKLEDLLCEKQTRSITRRGAGLSIMLHRVVSNDMDKEKPLFHFAIDTLVIASQTTISDMTGDIGNEKDIPKAIFIHLMTKMVADSSLASDVMYYSATLAELAFRNLTSEQWQIRNAALQLYGSLVPKLIGQKKASSSNQDSGATVACDELRTHCPKLWAYTEKQLDSRNIYEDIIQAHSNLVPILNILASTAKKYNFSHDTNETIESEVALFMNLMKLLNSPIYTVRRLTAKSIELMYPFHMIYDYILGTKDVTENMLHGLLLLVEFCKNQLPDNDKKFLELQNYFKNITDSKRHCSNVVMNTYVKLFWKVEGNLVQTLKFSIGVLNNDRYAQGVFVWLNTIVEICILNCPNTDIPDIIKLLLGMSDLELYCKFIMKRLRSDNDIPQDVLKEITVFLTEYEKKFECAGIWKILHHICSNNGNIMFEDNVLSVLDEYLKTRNYTVPHKIRYIIPFIAKILVSSGENKTFCDLVKFSHLVFALTDYERVEVDMRYMAAIANNSLGSAITTLPLPVQVNVLKSALKLIQDDDEDVRFEAAHFYSIVTKEKYVCQPFICLQKILNCVFLHRILKDNVSEFIEELNRSAVETNTRKDDNRYNPFLIETRNIYAEPQVFAHYVGLIRILDEF